LAGFRQEMKSAGLPIPDSFIYEIPGSESENAVPAVKHYGDLGDRPTALVCFNDMMAIGVLKNLQQRGVRVPEEFSITGFDNIIFSNYTNPPLTTFDQPKRFIGQKAAELILSLLVSTAAVNPPEQKIQILRGNLLVRESTAPPSSTIP
jgi:DNA-binding LacI/PurR family transcriptional regulator